MGKRPSFMGENALQAIEQKVLKNWASWERMHFKAIRSYLSTTIPFIKHKTAGKTLIFNFSTKNLAFSTLILANFVSKYFSVSF